MRIFAMEEVNLICVRVFVQTIYGEWFTQPNDIGQIIADLCH